MGHLVTQFQGQIVRAAANNSAPTSPTWFDNSCSFMCAFRCLATIFSSIFDRKLRLDIGR